MGNYVRKAGSVQAVRLDPTTGDITISGVTAHAGNWLVVADDGAIKELDDTAFTGDYEAAPEPAADPAAAEVPTEPAASV